MAKLYERFILEYYRQNHPYLTEVKAAQVKWDLVGEHDAAMLRFLPAMQTDIFLRFREKVLILDAKYYSQTLQQQDYQCIASETFERIDDLFAAILAKGVSRQLKQGLYREYVSRSETRSVLRGKLDLPQTIKPVSSTSHRSPVPLTSFPRITCITRF